MTTTPVNDDRFVFVPAGPRTSFATAARLAAYQLRHPTPILIDSEQSDDAIRQRAALILGPEQKEAP
jgi:hypothetical protein